MELWLAEKETEHLHLSVHVEKVVHSEKSSFQHIAVLETQELGKVLLLDGVIQTSSRDEFIYHEMLVHVPLLTHKGANSVLVVGGGDGGAVRELLKHNEVAKVDLVEIDPKVVDVSLKYLPELSGELAEGLRDGRVTLTYRDGATYVQDTPERYDVVIVDAPDPVGPAETLFEPGFYAGARKILRDGGLFAAQTGPLLFGRQMYPQTHRAVASVFDRAYTYLAPVPTYSVGPWTFTLGSTDTDPLEVQEARFHEIDTRYYSLEVHKAAFALPRFARGQLENDA